MIMSRGFGGFNVSQISRKYADKNLKVDNEFVWDQINISDLKFDL